jgi:hypothetical protein
VADETQRWSEGSQGPPPSAWGAEAPPAGQAAELEGEYDPPPYQPPGYEPPAEDEPAPAATAPPSWPEPQGHNYPPPPPWGQAAGPTQAQGYPPAAWDQGQGYPPPGPGQAQGYVPAPGQGWPPTGTAPQAGQYPGWGQPPKPGQTLSILAIVLGVLALIFSPLGVVAVVLGIVATVKHQRRGTLALVIAIAGLFLGIVIDILVAA